MKIVIINIKERILVRDNGILKISVAEMKELPTIKNTF